MSVRYKDYYKTLGVDRKASQEEIRKAYRKLARQFHPDVNPGKPEAEEKFKDVQEAYAVLSDAEKRAHYDQLGQDWTSGADFTPPPGWSGRFDFGEPLNERDIFDESGGFSDFFQFLFGGLRGSRPTASPQQPSTGKGDVEAEIELSLEDLHHGARPTLSIRTSGPCPRCGGRGTHQMRRCPQCGGSGQVSSRKRTMTVRIPPGLRPDSVLRITGKGEERGLGRPPGDLYLRIKVKPHARFRLTGDDLSVELPVAPWEAALGCKVNVPTLEGSVEMTIPPGTQSGTLLRLRGQGLRRRDGSRGDQLVRVRIEIPTALSPEEEELFRKLSKVSRFDPRG